MNVFITEAMFGKPILRNHKFHIVVVWNGEKGAVLVDSFKNRTGQLHL